MFSNPNAFNKIFLIQIYKPLNPSWIILPIIKECENH